MAKMHFERQARVNLSVGEARQRAEDYMLRLGYSVTSIGSPLLFKRGSTLGSLASFSPKGWRANAAIDVVPAGDYADITATVEVDATGQIIVPKEKAFLERELDGLVAVLQGDNPDTIAQAPSERSLVSQNVIIVVLALVAGIIVNIIVRFSMGPGADSGLLSPNVVAGVLTSLVILGIAMLWLRRKS